MTLLDDTIQNSAAAVAKSAGRLFNRVARITIVKPLKQTEAWFQTQDPKNAIQISDLRVQIKTARSISKHPNTCTVTISNLAPQTRSQVEVKPQIVIVEAGFDNTYKRLFTGDLQYAMTSRDGTDWNTMFQLGDGDRAYRFSRVSRSYPPGTGYGQIVNDVASALSVTVPSDVAAAIARSGRQAVNGYTLHGPAQEEMSRLMLGFGLEWSIQDAQFQALADGVPRLDNRSVFVISQDTGMIGSPEYGAPPQPGKKPLLKVKTQLYAGIMPGHQVQVKSRAINGLFRVEQASDTADTHGPNWMTELEVTQL